MYSANNNRIDPVIHTPGGRRAAGADTDLPEEEAAAAGLGLAFAASVVAAGRLPTIICISWPVARPLCYRFCCLRNDVG